MLEEKKNAAALREKVDTSCCRGPSHDLAINLHSQLGKITELEHYLGGAHGPNDDILPVVSSLFVYPAFPMRSAHSLCCKTATPRHFVWFGSMCLRERGGQRECAGYSLMGKETTESDK